MSEDKRVFVKATATASWYKVGDIIQVLPEKSGRYFKPVNDQSQYIREDDCEICEQPQQKEEPKRVLVTTFNHSKEETVVDYDDNYYKIVDSKYYDGWLVRKDMCTDPQPQQKEQFSREQTLWLMREAINKHYSHPYKTTEDILTEYLNSKK